MTIKVFNTYEEMSVAAANFIAEQIKRKPDSLLCLPSGDTPTGTLKILVEYGKSGKVDFSKCTFVGLDEWVGMDKTNEGSCQHYVYEHFFIPLQIRPGQIFFFNAKAGDLKAECEKIDRFLDRNGPIDLTLVGVGVNGHIGLNEPGVSPSLKCHVVELETTTKQTAQKYFNSQKTLDKGITLGLRHILSSETIVVLANGQKKKEIIQKIVEGPVTQQVPGSVLQKHSNCYFFLDTIAATELKG